EIAKRAKSYELQAGVYTLASEAAGFPVREFVFFFTAPALASTINPDEEWLSRQRDQAEIIAGRIQALDYGPEPTYEPGRCSGCEFLALCRPKGVPVDEIATRPQVTAVSEAASESVSR